MTIKNDKLIYTYFKDKYDRKSKSWVKIKKIWWNKKLFFRWNKTMIWWVKSIERRNYLNYVAFASLDAIPVGITSSAVGIKICAITAGMEKYKSIIKKKKKKLDKAVLLENS